MRILSRTGNRSHHALDVAGPALSTAPGYPRSKYLRSANGKLPRSVSGDGKCGRSTAVSAVSITFSADSSGKLFVQLHRSRFLLVESPRTLPCEVYS